MLDEDAGVFDHEQAGGAGFGGRGGVGDSLLHPDYCCADFDGAVDYWRDVFGAAEDVDDFDVVRWRDVFETRVGFFAEDFCFVGIYGNDAVAGGLHVLGDAEAGACGAGRKANDGDGFVFFQDVGDDVGALLRVIGERDVHRRAQRARLKLSRAAIAAGAKWFVAVPGFVRISWAAGVGAAAWSCKFVSWSTGLGITARSRKFVSWTAGFEVAAWTCEFVSWAAGLEVAAWACEFST